MVGYRQRGALLADRDKAIGLAEMLHVVEKKWIQGSVSYFLPSSDLCATHGIFIVWIYAVGLRTTIDDRACSHVEVDLVRRADCLFSDSRICRRHKAKAASSMRHVV